MWITVRPFVVFVLLVSSASADRSGSNDTLEDIFASAVAEGAQSFMSISTMLGPELAATMNATPWDVHCSDAANNFSVLSECLQKHATACLSLQDVRKLYKISPGQNLSKEDVVSLSPALLYSILFCKERQVLDLSASQNRTSMDVTPTAWKMSTDSRSLELNELEDQKQQHIAILMFTDCLSWGYSFLFVTLINLCSLTGALLLPCMKMKGYRLVLMFMVALAVGSLVGSGLLFLIPEAFMLVHHEGSDYVWKSTTIMSGIYLFYLTEKIMRMINTRREDTNLKKQRDELATKDTITTSFRRIPLDNSIPGKDPTQIVESMGRICSSQLHSPSSFHSSTSEVTSPNILRTDERDDDIDVCISNIGDGDWEKPCNGHGHLHHHHHHLQSDVAPVAYMIIFGDALHNFIDGLSIGSAFTQSVMTGVSVSIAVMCEELPHELGDFAILLNSGMHFRKALMYNFLSACTCYVGTIVGILLAENTESHEWIFAVAGGMFLYISLVDMMPEMNTAAESEEAKLFGETKTLILQNSGLITGYSIMLIFALYGGNIRFG